MLAPGGIIGILGGGQLGRMTALAAAHLGYRCHVFANEADSPAAQVCCAATVAEFTDRKALQCFASAVDIVTFEFENIPAEAVRRVAGLKPVLPRPEILEIAQDRLREKDFLRSIGVETAAYRKITEPAALTRAMRDFGYPAVFKTVRLGYDGKGQVTLTPEIDIDEAWRRMGGEIGVLEAFVDFSCEISVIVARGDCAPHRRKARSRRPACRRDVCEQERRSSRQRDCAAPAQFGSLDDRRLRHQPVRAAREGRVRAAARFGRTSFGRGDEEPTGERCREMARSAR
jgi:formate-dependent phosphoribosylglycinamide formyltransferase (GAR transformylase)